MADHGIFSVSQFAKLTRTTRDILLNYDKLGLLSPVMRKGNNYRYYSSDQLAMANVIRMLLELGTPLAKIKRLKDRRTPENTCETLKRQMEQIDEKIEYLTAARKLISILQKNIDSVLDIDEQAITVQFLPEEAFILGDVNDYRNARNDYDALHSFYNEISERRPDVNLSHPIWALFSEERIKRNDWVLPDRYYFYTPEGHDRRPAAHYAIGYTRGGYGQTDGLYRRLLDYIDQNGFEICGDAYEEYPLNEVCISNDENYLIRVMITVRVKENG